ncbi:MAG: hypothetical protein M3P84_06410 [Chloroflexota bacterium]|nr:hypothetical protein [Chloroflexota bacterium]
MTTPPSPTPTGGGAAAGGEPTPGGSPTTQRREVLHQGYHVETYRDGSTLRLDGEGGAEFRQGPNAAQLRGGDWVDPRTGQRVHGGLWASADHRLREIEVNRGLRQSIQP